MSADRRLTGFGTRSAFLLTRQIKDYAQVGINLIWHRQLIFGAALLLAGYYYSLELALVTAGLIACSEAYDLYVFRSILAWSGRDVRVLRRYMWLLVFGTILSGSVIVTYAIAIALIQGPGAHFMSLFFLFAAALFAAMNNHQVVPILIIRLVLYAGAFMFIPIYDILIMDAPISSELWAQLFTSLFVLYFVIDCSRVYLAFYRNSFNQLEALREEHKKAQAAYRAKTEFVSTMSHELRTPLTSIKGSIDLAAAGHLGPLPEPAAQAMSIAQRNAVRLISLIDEILDLQKLESGRLDLRMEEVEVGDLLEQAVAANRPFAERLGVHLDLVSPAEELVVRGDQARLEQVLANMLSNAAKFSPPGSTVRVDAACVGTRVRIRVVDEGFGLSETERERVFDKFSQVDSSDTRKIGGTGLGMNISKQIMQAHGGTIDYHPNEGAGTTFFIELELFPDDMPANGSPAAAIAAE